MTNTTKITQLIAENISTQNALSPIFIQESAETMIAALKSGRKLLFAGNGGSAADAQHIVAELMGRFLIERGPLPAIALTTNASSTTAIANDYGYDQIFQRQLEALATPGDVFVGISTSGNSENVLNAVKWAKNHQVYTIGLTGKSGGKLLDEVDYLVPAPSSHTPRIQESHILIGHIWCELIDQAFAKA